jgi:hypothetical protein
MPIIKKPRCGGAFLYKENFFNVEAVSSREGHTPVSSGSPQDAVPPKTMVVPAFAFS